MRYTPLFAAAAALAVASPAAAHNHGPHEHGAHEHEGHSLDHVLAMSHRDEDRARDQYRNPAETLAFFQIEPTMRVAEYGPGGGWYTRVLLPWIGSQGQYFAFQAGRDPAEDGSTWPQRFTTAVAQADWSGSMPVTAFESDAIPEDVVGTLDRVLIFRSIHGLLNGNRADAELRAIRTLLSDDGMVGVVQHRAPEDASYGFANGSNGYLRQSDVVRLFELHGFELAGSSEVNANSDDPANWEGGVWTLPPTLRYGDEDRARYEAIGESDRMTLLFRKRD
ncbi:class I SAM-dependent methyltransferase [Aurantiacibacter sediminis]|uniref:Class I SAM-dependent methyltransferase n=2 Tax=Aurantiacibacter sediminis TaxID=2793064 RepID=A0ABS0N376_9SPHN|nr:class I SAM-dependent methyltransferase [Aurantiacibacter sediminis]